MALSPERKAAIRAALPEIDQVEDPVLRDQILQVWDLFWAEGDHRELAEAPFSPSIPGERLIPHVRAVTRAAMALLPIMAEFHPMPIHRDNLLAAALLHDVSKLVELSASGSYTFLGKRYPHSFLSVEQCRRLGLPEDVIHLIATHSPKIHMEPVLAEGDILHHADMISFALIKRRNGMN